ncbi:exported protein of unknown function [Nitrospira defluvii]|jgi:hypothetical protein|uniref:Uncharacterized protein n=1 Tax=Nitrospira defluvii TaxID=330214 RepID=D8PBS5_9BACT|nr:exported protein of unknown function [Nitrospira defluvii]
MRLRSRRCSILAAPPILSHAPLLFQTLGISINVCCLSGTELGDLPYLPEALAIPKQSWDSITHWSDSLSSEILDFIFRAGSVSFSQGGGS